MSYDDLGDISLPPEFVEMFDSIVADAEADVENKRGDSLGDRMKSYESKQTLDPTTPVIIRVDGRAFHTFTRGFKKPYDRGLASAMQDSLYHLCKAADNCVFGYTQSDEISICLVPRPPSQPWFGNSIQKLTSISASLVTAVFNSVVPLLGASRPPAMFDARAFNIPADDIVNYFIWRQLDTRRNAVSAAARAEFSHKQLQGKSCGEMLEMLRESPRPFDSYCNSFRRGVACIRDSKSQTYPDRRYWRTDDNTPDFILDRLYISKWLE